MNAQDELNTRQGEFNGNVVEMVKVLSSRIMELVQITTELSSRLADIENSLDDVEASKKLYKAVEEIQEDLAVEHNMTFVHRL